MSHWIQCKPYQPPCNEMTLEIIPLSSIASYLVPVTCLGKGYHLEQCVSSSFHLPFARCCLISGPTLPKKWQGKCHMPYKNCQTPVMTCACVQPFCCLPHTNLALKLVQELNVPGRFCSLHRKLFPQKRFLMFCQVPFKSGHKLPLLPRMYSGVMWTSFGPFSPFSSVVYLLVST